MNNLSRKYEGRYNITNSENLDDGKFVVGYNSKNRTMIMISTYKKQLRCKFFALLISDIINTHLFITI